MAAVKRGMWYDLARHRRRARGARVAAGVLGAAGIALAAFGLLAVAVGVVMLITDEHPAIGGLTVVVGGLLTAAGALALSGASRRWARWARLDRIADALTPFPAMGPSELEHALGWPRTELCEALLWAACAELVHTLPAPLHGERGERGSIDCGDVLDGRYRLVEVLGEGGMGRVFRGVDVLSGVAVAVKVPHAGKQDRERLAREANLLAQVTHPHVQRLRFVGTTADGTPYVVTDLLRGETLEQRLERVGQLPWREALALLRPLAGALSAAHAAGVLHRDLKPSNVFLEHGPEGERPILIDFGLARRLDASSALTRSGAAIGTPLYRSPEQARGEALDRRSDVYGLAQLLFEMIAGTPPWFDVTEAKIYERMLHAPPPGLAPQGVPSWLDAAIARGLAKEREQRFEDIDALLRAFDVPEAEHVA